MRSTTIIETPRAGVYLKQLCRHFGHKVETTFDDHDGRISFAFGECELRADDGRLELTGHLERFAFREELRVTWPGDAPEGV